MVSGKLESVKSAYILQMYGFTGRSRYTAPRSLPRDYVLSDVETERVFGWMHSCLQTRLVTTSNMMPDNQRRVCSQDGVHDQILPHGNLHMLKQPACSQQEGFPLQLALSSWVWSKTHFPFAWEDSVHVATYDRITATVSGSDYEGLGEPPSITNMSSTFSKMNGILWIYLIQLST